MIQGIQTHVCELRAPLQTVRLHHALAAGDRLGDRFEITVLRGGEPVDLTDVAVTGQFLRADGATVPLAGAAAGSVASVELPGPCYAVAGGFSLAVRAALGDGLHTLYLAEGQVLTTTSDALVDTEHVIPDVADLLALLPEMDAAAERANTAADKASEALEQMDAALQTVDETITSFTDMAGEALQNLNENITNARDAAERAEAAATQANAAADKASVSAEQVATVLDKVDETITNLVEKVDTALDHVDAAIDNARDVTERAESTAQEAATAAASALTAAAQAESAATDASAAAAQAESAAQRLSHVALEVEALPPGAEPTGSVSQTDDTTMFELGIPQAGVALAAFEVDDDMQLLMHHSDFYDSITFSLTEDGYMEVTF